MQIVIDISEKQYEITKEFIETVDDKSPLAKAIVNGTPLPKGKWIVGANKDSVCCPFCNTKVKNCMDEIRLLGTAFSGLNYCQYCGADMRGDENADSD